MKKSRTEDLDGCHLEHLEAPDGQLVLMKVDVNGLEVGFMDQINDSSRNRNL